MVLKSGVQPVRCQTEKLWLEYDLGQHMGWNWWYPCDLNDGNRCVGLVRGEGGHWRKGYLTDDLYRSARTGSVEAPQRAGQNLDTSSTRTQKVSLSSDFGYLKLVPSATVPGCSTSY